MTFLNPAFLWALTGITIPIVIHLFNFRRAQKIFFTNVGFLKNVQISTKSFRRLKNLLVLISRVLFISCMVLAFAQPFINNNSASSGYTTNISSIYLDNSLSMQNRIGNQTYLDIAATETEKLINSLPSQIKLQFLTSTFEDNEQFLINRSKLADRITEIDFTNTFRSAEVIQSRQQSLLRKYGTKTRESQFFWISDFQKSTVGDLSKLQIDSTDKYYLLPIQSTELGNIYVDSVWLSTPFIRESESNVLKIKVVNTGKEKIENKSIKLFIDNQQASTSSITIEGKSQTIVPFNFAIQGKGYKKGRIQFDDEPVNFDNEYFFVLNVAPVISVVHLYGQSNHKYIESVFSNETIFTLKSVNSSSIDPSIINTADLIILDELNTISDLLINTLNEFLAKGGSVMIFPSGTLDKDVYTTLCNKLGIRGFQKNITKDGKFDLLNLPDINNPFFSSIFENVIQTGVVNMPSAQPIISWGNNGNVLLKYKNNQPFISQIQSGMGKVYICASPLNTNFSEFAKHALFVPIMYKIAALSKPQEQMAYTFSSQNVAVEIEQQETMERNNVFHLRKNNFDLIPQQQISEKRLVFELPQSNQAANKQTPDAGYYELVLNGKVQKLMAFNYDKRESQTDFYSPEELKLIFAGKKNVQIYENVAEKDFVTDFKEKNIGLNLWKYFLVAALVFLMTEILIIRFFK